MVFVFLFIGQFLLDQNRKIEGADMFDQAAKMAPNQLSVIYNAGNAFRSFSS